MQKLRIGLDIDDCLVDFWGAYCEYFNTHNNPKMLKDYVITRNVQQVLSKDRNFWLNLEVKNRPNFTPELYCTKRIINKSITKKYLSDNKFPKAPIYQQYYQKGSKFPFINGKVDLFIDDSIANMVDLNLKGVPCLLFSTDNNITWGPYGRVYSLDINEIMDVYNLFIKTIFPNFKCLIN